MQPSPPGTGPLTLRLVLGHAAWMFRHDLGRIAATAFVVFVPPAGLGLLTNTLRSGVDSRTGTGRLVFLALLVTAVALARALGEVFYAGFLDLAVGDHRFRGHRPTAGEVVRRLPWGRLIVADLLVAVLAALAGLVLVVPGLVVYTAFGIVGPVLVQEDRTVPAALRRCAGIARRAWPWILGLVVVPLALEHLVAEAVRHFVHGGGTAVVLATEWLLGTAVLGAVGVLEVALATELMVRIPAPPAPVRRAAAGGGPTPRGAAD